MADRRLLLRDWQVRAALDSRLRQVWLPLKPQPLEEPVLLQSKKGDYFMANFYLPYQTGDRLWVAEAWAPVNGPCRAVYRADIDNVDEWRWEPSSRMPRTASRLSFEVKAVRIARVQDASEEDMRAYGCTGDSSGSWGCEGLVEDFSEAWDEQHGRGSWERNDWCGVYDLRRIEAPPTPRLRTTGREAAA